MKTVTNAFFSLLTQWRLELDLCCADYFRFQYLFVGIVAKGVVVSER